MRCVPSVALVAAFALMPAAAAAQQPAAVPLRIQDGWARPQAELTRPAGGYVRIENTGADTVVITDASCTPARRTEIHEMVMQDDMMRMQRVPALVVAPGATVAMRPGGMHIMLMELTEPLAAGTTFPCSFTLRDGSRTGFTLTVRAP